MADALTLLSKLEADNALSDSVRCFSFGTKLALELAAGQRVAPTVKGHQARWMALLTRQSDRERAEALANAMPIVCRAVPSQSRGSVRIRTAMKTTRDFLDAAVDAVYRRDVYPGSSRGWVLEFAQALRASSPDFRPRSARDHAVVEALGQWAKDDAGASLRLGVQLLAPDTDISDFTLTFFCYDIDEPCQTVPLEQAFQAGASVRIGSKAHSHPAAKIVSSLARAVSVFPQLLPCLEGAAPRSMTWDANAAWTFLAEGVPALENAGFRVDLPKEFQGAGARRIRARMRVDAGGSDKLTLDSELDFVWEVVLGDRVLSGAQFSELLKHNAPIVPFEGSWVLLDPVEVAKLPKGLPLEGKLDTATALRAVLVGSHQDVEVVADADLELMFECLA